MANAVGSNMLVVGRDKFMKACLAANPDISNEQFNQFWEKLSGYRANDLSRMALAAASSSDESYLHHDAAIGASRVLKSFFWGNSMPELSILGLNSAHFDQFLKALSETDE